MCIPVLHSTETELHKPMYRVHQKQSPRKNATFLEPWKLFSPNLHCTSVKENSSHISGKFHQDIWL